MLEKAANYKGVVIFYLLLILVLLALAYQSRIYNDQLDSNNVNITMNQ